MTYMYMFLMVLKPPPLDPKMYTRVIVPALGPSFLQRSQWYFGNTYLRWSRSAIQNFGLVAKDSAKWRLFSIFKKISLFVLLSKSVLVVPTKRGREIAWSKGELIRKYDLKWPWLWEMAVIWKVKISFLHFFWTNKPKLHEISFYGVWWIFADY